MQISIIVPVYNVGAYLNECIESVLKLKTQAELILVDDGSTDESGSLCDEWAAREPGIKVIHQQNGGLSAARNTGIRNATGEYLLFLDADDLLDVAETERLLEGLHTGCEVLLGLYKNYYPLEDRLEKETADSLAAVEGETPIDTFLQALPADGQSCYMIACRFAVQRAFLLKNDLFFLPGIYHEDEEWTQRLLCCLDRIFVSHHYFYIYRQAREGAITAAVRPKHLWDTFSIMEKIESLLLTVSDGSVKSVYLQQRLAQLFLNNLIHLFVLPKKDRGTAVRKLKAYKSVFSAYGQGRWGKPVKLSMALIGIRGTGFLLSVATKLLNR